MALSVENFQVELEKVTNSVNRAFNILAFHNDGEAIRRVEFEDGEVFKKSAKLSGNEISTLNIKYKAALEAAISRLETMKKFID